MPMTATAATAAIAKAAVVGKVLATAATLVGTGIGVYSSIQQSKAQSAQAKYQEKISKRNAEIAEQQASAQRRQGYEDMLNQRRRTAAMIGQQRAIAGSSGTVVDFGSIADVTEETAMRGEFDAVNTYNRGIDTAYNSEIQAWNYSTQADAYDAQSSSYRQAGVLGALGTAAGGIAQMGSTWANFNSKYPSSQAQKYTYDPALGDYVKGGRTWSH